MWGNPLKPVRPHRAGRQGGVERAYEGAAFTS